MPMTMLANTEVYNLWNDNDYVGEYWSVKFMYIDIYVCTLNFIILVVFYWLLLAN